MKRILKFDGEKAATRFEFCHRAVLMAGNGKGERTRERLRQEARLLDVFESVSVADEDAVRAGDTDARRLVQLGEQRVELQQEDFATLEEYVNTAKWTPRAARQAVDVQDWLSAAEKIDG